MASMSVKKVLIVEDSTSLNTLYQQYLRNEKVEILTAGNGAETKYLVANHEPSLVLLDLGLPDIKGMDLLEWIKSEYPHIEVVIITSQNAIDTVVEVMRLGALDFIEKPFDGKRLITTVKNALKQNKIKKLTFDNPNVFKDKISLLFFNLIKVHIEDKNKINGNMLITILGIIIKDSTIGKPIPTS